MVFTKEMTPAMSLESWFLVSFFVVSNYAPFKLLVYFENFTLPRWTPLLPLLNNLLTPVKLKELSLRS